ncbi:hypothetical protein [Nocardia sp. NPDC057272]|uniref:hypothetical protein n=1 Tax=Nocardia sp. NPDC057272 TaxID=3346079 RepID=UPI00362713F3
MPKGRAILGEFTSGEDACSELLSGSTAESSPADRAAARGELVLDVDFHFSAEDFDEYDYEDDEVPYLLVECMLASREAKKDIVCFW